MNDIYEKIYKDNLELRNSKTLQELYEKIFVYMKNSFNICNLKILLENEISSELLYEFNKEECKHECEHKTKIKIFQNNYIEINYLIDFQKIEELSELKNKSKEINLALQEFSQTLYIKYLEEQNNKLSLVDKTTGLHNRHYLDNYIDNVLNISNREQKKVGFLKISIDKFKAVIDEFDYSIGDKVLKILAKTLTQTVRSSDIVLKFEGGDFLVILLNVINEENTIMISNKIIENFKEKEIIINKKNNQVLKKTMCIGVALYPDDASSIDEIIKKADIALYEAKNLGRSKVFKYNEEETNTIDFF